VNENALAHELRNAGLAVAQHYGATVICDGTVVGAYCVDLLVEDAALIELKTVRALDEAHRVQCVNHLAATDLRLCLLRNFDKPRLQIRRVVSRR
jgi:GxxExxY protein